MITIAGRDVRDRFRCSIRKSPRPGVPRYPARSGLRIKDAIARPESDPRVFFRSDNHKLKVVTPISGCQKIKSKFISKVVSVALDSVGL
jgi:hypothetical protein